MGVYTRGNGRFFCTARIEGKQKYIGSYPSPKEAALEYDKFVFAYRGENYVSYNFPELLGLDENKAYKWPLYFFKLNDDFYFSKKISNLV